MARKELDCLTRRSMLNSKNETPETLTAIGLEFMENGYLSDAIDFLAKAENKEALAALTPQAIEQGDFFLFNRIKKILKMEPSIAELQTLAAQAETQGKVNFAAQAKDRLEKSGLSAGEE